MEVGIRETAACYEVQMMSSSRKMVLARSGTGAFGEDSVVMLEQQFTDEIKPKWELIIGSRSSHSF